MVYNWTVFFFQERDKLILTRTVIYELVNVMRFKSVVPDDNLLMMVQVCKKFEYFSIIAE